MALQEKDVHEKLSQIEAKLDTIDGKLSEKWVLPVILAVLSAVLGTLNFLIERNVNKGDVREIKQNEVIAEYIAKSKIEFYQQSREHINNIDEEFESYCILGREKEVEKRLDALLIAFRKFIQNQQVIDQNIMEKLKEYSEFVSESAFDIGQSTDKSKVKTVYAESKAMYEDIRSLLDVEIGKLMKI